MRLYLNVNFLYMNKCTLSKKNKYKMLCMRNARNNLKIKPNVSLVAKLNIRSSVSSGRNMTYYYFKWVNYTLSL